MIPSIRRKKRDSGSTFVEFALVATMFMTVIYATFDLGRALYAYDWVSTTARQATRYAMVRGKDCQGLSSGCPAGADDVTTYVRGLATGIDTSQLTVTSGCYYGTTRLSDLPCTAASGTPNSVQVQVQYNFKFLSPLLYRSWTMHSISQRVVQN